MTPLETVLLLYILILTLHAKWLEARIDTLEGPEIDD